MSQTLTQDSSLLAFGTQDSRTVRYETQVVVAVAVVTVTITDSTVSTQYYVVSSLSVVSLKLKKEVIR